MVQVLPTPRSQLSPFAPRISTITINPDKVREVIGKGGATIQSSTKETGTPIDISDDGTITIAAVDGKATEAAIARINARTKDVEIGKIYEVQCANIMDFDPFVNYAPG